MNERIGEDSMRFFFLLSESFPIFVSDHSTHLNSCVMNTYTTKSVLIGVLSFIIVLFTMPLAHAMMIIMEQFMAPPVLYYAAFAMGAVGLAFAIIGVYAKGDTRQTLWGLFGGLLFWAGWVEFLFVYYTHRFGVAPLTDATGAVVTKPEYLILPATFGLWVMIMVYYIFNVKSGCYFIQFFQKLFFRKGKNFEALRPVARHTSIVTFMELNMVTWTSYLVLLFCYDDQFLGDHHPVTAIVAFGCLIASIFMFRKLIQINAWGYSIRYAIATVIVFWSFVEVIGRWNLFQEIWIHPMAYKTEMITMLVAFILFLAILGYQSKKRKGVAKKE